MDAALEEPEPEFSPEELPDEPEHAAGVAAMPQADALKAWSRWKESPSPQRMADTLHAVDPVIQRSVSRFPRYHPAILSGEAKRLAIGAIKTYDPALGTALATHLYHHLKPLGRNLANLSRAIPLSRLERERAAKFLGGQNDLREDLGREPSDAELQDHLKVDAGNLTKMRLAARGEVAEGQADHLGASDEHHEDTSRLSLWSDYVYHDATPTEQSIMDLSLGRNGHPQHDGLQIAAKLGFTPQYVNRKREELAKRIIAGMQAHEAAEADALRAGGGDDAEEES